MGKTITAVMMADHNKIGKLLKDIEDAIGKDIKKAEELFTSFKWNIEKHFFVEEKVIFTIYSLNNETANEDLLSLLKEHKDIFWLINKIEENFSENANSEIPNLIDKITSHAKFENEIFYPRLDEELDENQKKLITDRCNEVVVG